MVEWNALKWVGKNVIINFVRWNKRIKENKRYKNILNVEHYTVDGL